MHCASCERVIGDALKKLPGVEETEVNLRQKRAGIRVADQAPEPNLAALNAELSKLGYWIGVRPSGPTCPIVEEQRPWKQRLLTAIAAIIGAGMVFTFLLQPLVRFVPAISASGSLLALLAFGIIASLSTCLASTGAFLLAYSAESRSRSKVALIHIGRLVAFAGGGALLGALGGSLPSQTWLYGLVALILGVGFLFVGLHMLDLTPSLASRGLRLPRRFNDWADRLAKRHTGIAPFFVGMVTFVLPCGFTQTAQALALASGSASRGALMMTMFALGTMPVLVGLTMFGGAAALKHRFIRLSTGSLLVLFAFGQMDGGLTVLGSPVTFGGLAGSVASVFKSAPTIPPTNAGVQIVDMTVAYGTFSPRQFTIKRGVPVRWNINGVDVSGCANSIVAPKLGIARALTTGMNVIEFTPKQSGIIPFSCSMGMIRGSFTVID